MIEICQERVIKLCPKDFRIFMWHDKNSHTVLWTWLKINHLAAYELQNYLSGERRLFMRK
jgi:hypothetical protein